MSSSYPKVHVVGGSGAYYSYRPITRFIEKVERNHYRDLSSKPKDFGQYLAASSSSKGDGYRRAPPMDRDSYTDYVPRGVSLPPYPRTSKASEMASEMEKEFQRDCKEFARDPEEDILHRLRKKHPYRLAVENESLPPDESTVWPANRKHFDLVSSYDCMVDFMGIRQKEKK